MTDTDGAPDPTAQIKINQDGTIEGYPSGKRSLVPVTDTTVDSVPRSLLQTLSRSASQETSPIKA